MMAHKLPANVAVPHQPKLSVDCARKLDLDLRCHNGGMECF